MLKYENQHTWKVPRLLEPSRPVPYLAAVRGLALTLAAAADDTPFPEEEDMTEERTGLQVKCVYKR